MKPLALSTMYAQQERFQDGAEFARYAKGAGYDAVEVSHSTSREKLEQILVDRSLAVTSFHQPAPWVRRENGRGNSSANLAAVDESERAAALDFARESLAWAARTGATKLVVHLGQVSDVHEQFEEELEMRRLFDSGQAADPRFPELREQAIARRRRESGPYLDAARRSLRDLVAAAEPLGIAIGIENRYHYHEIPHPEEYDWLLAGFAREQAGYWHDTGHAEVLDRLGFIAKRAWLDRLSGRCIGAHLHDVIGIGDHRAPGDGDLDWSYIVDGLRHLPAYTLEINQHQPDEKVIAAIGFLRGLGFA